MFLKLFHLFNQTDSLEKFRSNFVQHIDEAEDLSKAVAGMSNNLELQALHKLVAIQGQLMGLGTSQVLQNLAFVQRADAITTRRLDAIENTLEKMAKVI